MSWRLGVVLSLFAASAAVLYLAPPVASSVYPTFVYVVPMTLGPWIGTEGVPEEILPPDPNERASVRRTYRDGDRIAWISVAIFSGQDNETHRNSINRIFPGRFVSRVNSVPLSLSLGGSTPSSVPAVILHRQAQQLLVAYWHQMGAHVYGSEFGFRLALMRDMVLTRRAGSLLVRIAAPVDRDSYASQDLVQAMEIALPLYLALAGGVGR